MTQQNMDIIDIDNKSETKSETKQETKPETKPEIELVSIKSFDEVVTKRNLLRSIYSYGFDTPSKIQSKALLPMTQGHELIAQSHSGTGKTGTFVIGTLQLIDETIPKCQAMIITPTHELAKQVHDVVCELSKYLEIKIALCVGKTSIEENIKSLENCHIIIGTPGRVTDMMNRKHINKDDIKLLVLDEADEMLSGDFKKQLKTIISILPKKTQICLFSATITDQTLKISEAFMSDPIKILIERERLTLDEISQFYVMIEHEKFKYDIFKEIFNIISIGQCIVYTNTQPKAQWVYDSMIKDNNTCGVIYSSMPSHDRNEVLKDFRKGKFRILISTDLLSRGIDIQKLSVVINYDVPYDKECYIHRIGRSGRFGKRGVAINLVTIRDYRNLKEIEKFYRTTIVEMPDNINSYL